MDLSIVVPIHNTEQYLARCLDSVLAQGEHGYEIILIDDGSQDASGSLCDDYAARYAFISVLHQSNSGLSAARNAGIEKARGAYIMLLDSDDTLEPNSLNPLIECTVREKCDVTIGCAWVVDEDGSRRQKIPYSLPVGCYSRDEYIDKAICAAKKVTFCAQFMLYKAEFLREHKLLFVPGLIHEDEVWTPTVLLCADTVYYSGIFFYNHHMRSGSIMHSGNYAKSAASLLTICRKLDELYSLYPSSTTAYFRDKLCVQFLKGYLMTEEPKLYLKEFGRRFPLDNAKSFRQKAKATLFYLSPSLYRWLGHRAGHFA